MRTRYLILLGVSAVLGCVGGLGAHSSPAEQKNARTITKLARSASEPPPSSSLTWNGDLSPGGTSQYGYVQQCAGPNPPRGVSIVNSPVHPGYAHTAMFTVSDQSVAANCPMLGSAGHPNANMQSPALFTPGDNAYIGFSTYFPSSFPSNICTPWIPHCWMQIMEIYGKPYAGIPPIATYVNGNGRPPRDKAPYRS